jgi:uncharacterized protein
MSDATALIRTLHEEFAQGDKAVALGEYSGMYKATGNRFRAQFAHVCKVSGGKAVQFHQYTDTSLVGEALR